MNVHPGSNATASLPSNSRLGNLSWRLESYIRAQGSSAGRSCRTTGCRDPL